MDLKTGPSLRIAKQKVIIVLRTVPQGTLLPLIEDCICQIKGNRRMRYLSYLIIKTD